jgi:transposase
LDGKSLFDGPAQAVIGAVLTGGMSARAAALRFGVSENSVIRWVRRHLKIGNVAPSQIGGHKPRLLTAALRDWPIARAARDFTLGELVAELFAAFGVEMDYVHVWRFVQEERLSFKKSALPAEQLRPKVARHRERWQRYPKLVDRARFVFVDETWAKTNLAPLCGWAPVGQHLHAKVPYGPRKNDDRHHSASM